MMAAQIDSVPGLFTRMTTFSETAIGPYTNMLAAVIGYIDERRFELHQRIEVLVQGLNALAFQGSEGFQNEKRFFGLV